MTTGILALVVGLHLAKRIGRIVSPSHMGMCVALNGGLRKENAKEPGSSEGTEN